ncbi:MAG TPA: GNAT family N-acetyltransferase [Candidatus Stackebrandtia faecavium]|nr:GNAT family N-acetyltransferase [Candidatus Stackebrandtia faecavium]
MEEAMPQLQPVGMQHRDSYIAMLDDHERYGESYPWNDAKTARVDFARFVEELAEEAAGGALPHGAVQQLTYVLILGDEVVGEFRLRPYISEPYERYNGHIACNVKPSSRGKGYGSHGLALGLELSRGFGLDAILLTVDDRDNLPSIRVIENNGGRLLRSASDAEGRMIDSYWIDL